MPDLTGLQPSVVPVGSAGFSPDRPVYNGDTQ